MKKIRCIFSNNKSNMLRNIIIAILIGGLIILPSLYAWFNIKASWDPYGQTDQIPVGVVDEDEGATVHGEDIDAGKELTNELKNNDAMDLQFTNEQDALRE